MMKVLIETIDIIDEGVIIASRLSDNYFLFISDYDQKQFWINPSIVEFL